MDENYKLWLKSLRVDDKVAVEIFDRDTRVVFTEIAKITPKGGIRLKWNEDCLFRNGEVDSGDKWRMTIYHIIPITDELIQKETERQMIEKIIHFKDWEKLGIDSISQIYKILFKDGSGSI